MASWHALLAGTVVSVAAFSQAFAQEAASGGAQGEGPVDPVKITHDFTGDYRVLQALADKPGEVEVPGYGKVFYVPSTVDTVMWGYLPNRDSKPVLTVPAESIVVFDTVSHEGILEDQGRDPVEYFGSKGVAEEHVLKDAIAITASDIKHDFVKDGPHIVTGPIAIEGAEPGDVLKVETLELRPRVPYGVVSNRHGKGALAGEFPETPKPETDASADKPELYHNVFIFTPVRKFHNKWYGVMHNKDQEEVVFQVSPFLGIMGIAADTSEKVHSVPPGKHGGNMDVAAMGVGSTLYLPIQVPGALFYVGDPHNSQGDGEVALTALEQPQRGILRITLMKKGDPNIPSKELTQPFGETDEFWIPMGLNEDLDEAMKDSVRQSIKFLSESLNMDRATALAYMSAATDFHVSQVVDRTKGIHSLIRKDDFAGTSVMRRPSADVAGTSP
jgi:acetamidase/formamidase